MSAMKTRPHIDELKLVLDIQQAHCRTCCHYEEDWDGENSEIYCGAYCHNEDRPNHEGISNLKSFPFEADQLCWKPNSWCASLPIQDISPEGEFILLASRFYVSVLDTIAARHGEATT